MHRFSKVLKELMDEHNWDQVQLASLTPSMAQTIVSRLLRNITPPGPQHITSLFHAFTDEQERFLLVQAYLQDQLPEVAANHVDLLPAHRRLADAPPILAASLPPRLQRALAYLLDALTDNPPIADVIIDMARAHGWQDLGPAKSRGKVKYPPHKPDRRTTHSAEKDISGTALEILKAGHSPSPSHPK